ncbi:hypothetical protein PPL_03691 [Heterostelium album PN500]|uniref:Uncharacterized protein n=1 Tax=Heterostelium pallidum (strain ATCC 26659 / Pp 5 / PN500) TaxID=670386 RepID=D3B6E3_HETP5|nr:hypothetical protein PPL_03691 [Heterostelium album PN500]EFA82913.1 hypothetical protein PPL_03691 [Heterostelium album PN500]|eukprot:XP_020435030.1 hypothetical protein PPL_03691 [Heterostelium album PN500]
MDEFKSNLLNIYNLIKFDHSTLEWKLKNHPPKWSDLRTYYLLLAMVMPTVVMLLFLHLMRDIWSSIALFHLSCVVLSTIYMISYHLTNNNKTVTLTDKQPLLYDHSSIINKQNSFSDVYDDQQQQQQQDYHQDQQNQPDQQKQQQHIILNLHSNNDNKLIPWYSKVHQSFKPKTQYYIGILLFIFSVGIGLALYYTIAGEHHQ